MNKTDYDLIYLMTCAVNGVAPDKERAGGINLAALLQMSDWHKLTAIMNIPLTEAGIDDDRFSQAYSKAVRKNILLDLERAAIIDEFEQCGIGYMPLKGSLLKELYPAAGMREMSDNDILIDLKYRDKAREIMKARGYSVSHYGTGHCDQYTKPPVLNYELHISLFDRDPESPVYRYYMGLGKLMKKDSGNKHGYHIQDEDFYVYMTAHEFKHFNGGGTGIRSLLDCYVFVRELGGNMDWDYVTAQLEKMQISDYEKQRRDLAMKLFTDTEFPQLSADESELLEKFLRYGIYGTLDQAAKKTISRKVGSRKTACIAFILKRLFPSVSYVKEWYPFCRKNPLLIPAAYIWRWIKGLTVSRDKMSAELKALKNRNI